ncbi:unnamed protein product [Rhodiola kirilowii]
MTSRRSTRKDKMLRNRVKGARMGRDERSKLLTDLNAIIAADKEQRRRINILLVPSATRVMMNLVMQILRTTLMMSRLYEV